MIINKDLLNMSLLGMLNINMDVGKLTTDKEGVVVRTKVKGRIKAISIVPMADTTFWISEIKDNWFKVHTAIQATIMYFAVGD